MSAILQSMRNTQIVNMTQKYFLVCIGLSTLLTSLSMNAYGMRKGTSTPPRRREEAPASSKRNEKAGNSDVREAGLNEGEKGDSSLVVPRDELGNLSKIHMQEVDESNISDLVTSAETIQGLKPIYEDEDEVVIKRMVEYLKQFKNLLRLDLTQFSRFSQLCTSNIIELIPCFPELRELALPNKQISEQVMRDIQEKLPRLRVLSLVETTIDGEGFKHLPASLLSLNLYLCKIPDTKDFELIPKQCPNLRVLNLGATKIADETLITVVQGCKELTKLYLDDVTDTCIEAIVASCSNLRVLQTLEVTYKGLACLSKLLHLESLLCNGELFRGEKLGDYLKEAVDRHENGPRELNLFKRDGTHETDESLEIILRGCPNLTELILWEDPITDKGLDVMVEYCPKLEKLHLPVSKGITDAGVAKLVKLPHLTFLWYNRKEWRGEELKGFLGKLAAENRSVNRHPEKYCEMKY